MKTSEEYAEDAEKYATASNRALVDSNLAIAAAIKEDKVNPYAELANLRKEVIYEDPRSTPMEWPDDVITIDFEQQEHAQLEDIDLSFDDWVNGAED